jgi:mRNA-degrading endonuclease RelE of RelBE toxin-antitoxin system
VKIKIEDRVKEFIRELPDKDRRVIGEHIDRLTKHPNATGDIKKLRTRKPRWRMHISLKYTLFYYIDSDMVWIDQIMTIEQAHKKYGKI